MNKTEEPFQVKLVNWQDHKSRLSFIREKVFIQEQGVPPDLEWDEVDEDAVHVLAEDLTGDAIGTARVLKDGHIGRMAVLPEWRNKGVGSKMLSALMEYCTSKKIMPYLDAQQYAVGFYEKHGFIAEGEIFMDAGIPHRRMNLR